jgi:hypothetical protein
MGELSAAIEEFRTAYDDLLALVDQYPTTLREKAGACGDWSPRQVLAHCNGWIVEAEKRYDGYDVGDTRKVPYDFDEFNARSVTLRTDQSWEETVAELRMLVANIIERAGAISAEKAAAEERYGGWLDALAEDCRDHTEQIRDFAEVG